MARRLLSTEAVLEELELDDDFDVDEPMMAGSDDEFDDIEDVYLEDVEEDDDDNNSAAPPLLPPSNTPSSRSDSPLAGPLLSHLLPSLLLAHQWVLRLTFPSHQSTPAI